MNIVDTSCWIEYLMNTTDKHFKDIAGIQYFSKTASN